MVFAIIVAAGKGVRMNASTRKQYFILGHEPIFIRTVRRFSTCSAIDAIFLAVPHADVVYCRQLVKQNPEIKKSCCVISGGDSRQASVYRGLLAVESSRTRTLDMVVIHDGVRPFVTSNQIESCVNEARKTGACILAVPAQDTMKQVETDTGIIAGTLARNNIWLAQTPQVFQYEIIRDAHEQALRDAITGTDDAMLVERLGTPVSVVPGSRRNIKITTPDDLIMAKAFLEIKD